LPTAGLIVAAVMLAYFLGRARFSRSRFGMVDAAMIVVAMAVGTAAGMPILDAFRGSAREATLLENLQVFRRQVELYKVQHGGNPPLLYKGGFPQMTQPTNAMGVPGAGGKSFPFGPYLPGGAPANPINGSRAVASVEEFPPKETAANAGWLYHQPSGRIAPNAEGYLEQ